MEQLILIHGALGAADQMIPLKEELQDDFQVHTLEFDGHGEGAELPEAFSLEGFIEQLDFLLDESKNLSHIFGYSMGGFVALMSAANNSAKIKSITTLGTKMRWSPEIALKESKHLNHERIKEKVPQFAAALEKRHGAFWGKVLERTVDFMKSLGEEQPVQASRMERISIPVQLCLADQDVMVSEEETREVERWVENSTFNWIPNSKHPIEQVDLKALASIIRSFIQSID